jgi:CDP-4-dehydro-6-deoxyglucose reductase
MLEPWRTGKVIKIENASPTTRRFWIEIPELDTFDFKPGQFVTLDLPIHEQKNKRWRSYSIASAPDNTNVIELVIVLLEGGAGTTYLFNEVTVGSTLTLRGPQGVFTLNENLDRDLFLICTGTGIAPFRSMIHHIHTHNIQHPNIHLIFGCRRFTDCLYQDEFTQLTAQENRFFYHPVFSRETEVPNGMYKGYVHGVYENLLWEEKKPAHFYLCGWKQMIDEAKQRIIDLGYDKKDIHLELYG